jgi:transcriptional regulator with XRE-family HTH domain
MGSLEIEIGKALRQARLARGLTLRQVASLSHGRFRATSVASYERGERSISLVRFIELCRFYGTAPDGVLAILRSAEARAEPIVDLTILEELDTEEAALVSGFVRQVRALRSEHGGDAIVLRAGDLEVLATAAGKRPEELADLLRRRTSRTGEPPGPGEPVETDRPSNSR